MNPVIVPTPNPSPQGRGVAEHKAQLQRYFDGAGFTRWAAIYGDAPVSRIRRTVRNGHAHMLALAEAWLMESLAAQHNGLANMHVLDAGCGTGLFSVALAGHGCRVTGVDLAPHMVEAAKEQARRARVQARTHFVSDDLECIEGAFDAVACFDVLIHYSEADFAALLNHLMRLTRGPLLFTYAPHAPLLAALHWVGGRFPASDRRTTVQLIRSDLVGHALAVNSFRIKRSAHVGQGFYHVTLVEADRKEQTNE
jgi:magnesium-protoporphyrin O-methyltransferase